MYKLFFTVKADKELKNLSKRYDSLIKEALKCIKEEPLLGKKLNDELSGERSFRVGVYRIIYKINQKDKTILILAAGHRSIIYR